VRKDRSDLDAVAYLVALPGKAEAIDLIRDKAASPGDEIEEFVSIAGLSHVVQQQQQPQPDAEALAASVGGLFFHIWRLKTAGLSYCAQYHIIHTKPMIIPTPKRMAKMITDTKRSTGATRFIDEASGGGPFRSRDA
jgi:hypothetical protein